MQLFVREHTNELKQSSGPVQQEEISPFYFFHKLEETESADPTQYMS
jgi:hypothetical protein